MKSPTSHLSSIGKHWLIEIYGCPYQKLETIPFVKETLLQSANISGATIVSNSFHQFSPYGVSGVVVIEESHFTIHTWPEHGFAAIDFFTCGDGVDIQKAIDFLQQEFEAADVDVSYFDRGSVSKAKKALQNVMPNKF